MRNYDLAHKVSLSSCNPEQKHGVVVSPNHAEARALRPHVDYRGAKLYSARSNRRISKPCPDCMAKIRTAGIKEIIYVDINNNLIRERVR